MQQQWEMPPQAQLAMQAALLLRQRLLSKLCVIGISRVLLYLMHPGWCISCCLILSMCSKSRL